MKKFEEKYWHDGIFFVAGIDEAGRGPLAGPVVAASVIFPDTINIKNINDSKQLSPEEREDLYMEILDKAIAIGVGIVDNNIIDKINILQSTYKAMLRAVEKLEIMPEVILVDGYPIPNSPIKQEGIIKGDSKSISIAAASIIAKVYRDRIMEFYGIEYPEYDFSSNKGYGTKKHIEVVMKVGPCEIHRKSFSPIKELFNKMFKH